MYDFYLLIHPIVNLPVKYKILVLAESAYALVFTRIQFSISRSLSPCRDSRYLAEAGFFQTSGSIRARKDKKIQISVDAPSIFSQCPCIYMQMPSGDRRRGAGRGWGVGE